MSSFKNALIGASVTLVVLFSTFAHAYDMDNHFYMTYAMARYTGIRHEVASRIAMGAQWGDEHWVTTPMLGVKMRKVHFPGTVKASTVSAYSIWGLDPVVKTRALHDFTTEMFTEGLKEGYLFKAIQSFHTMQDSFSHHGTPQQLGHSYGGHWPDRPFWRSYEWYSDMVLANMEMLWAIRELLPDEAKDKDVRPAPGSPLRNWEMSSSDLAKSFLALPEVRYVATRNVLNDPEYVKFAVEEMVRLSTKQGYFYWDADLESLLKNHKYFKNEDANRSLFRLVGRMLQQETAEHKKSLKPGEYDDPNVCNWKTQILNRDFIAKDIGVYLCDPVWIRTHKGPLNVTKELISVLTQGHIPVPPSPYGSLIEVELEGPIREKEKEIRMLQVRNLIAHLFGHNVLFRRNKDLKKQMESIFSFSPPPRKEMFGSVVYHRNAGGHWIDVTMTDEDQNRYAHLMKEYLFPKLNTKTLLDEIIDGLGYWSLPLRPLQLRDKWLSLKSDLLESRIVPGPQNTYYRDIQTFNEFKGPVFKYLLSADTVRQMAVGSGAELREGGTLYESAPPAKRLP